MRHFPPTFAKCVANGNLTFFDERFRVRNRIDVIPVDLLTPALPHGIFSIEFYRIEM